MITIVTSICCVLYQINPTVSSPQTYASEFPRDEALDQIVSELLDRITASIAPLVSPGLTGQEFVPDYLMATVANLVGILELHLGTGDVSKEQEQEASRLVDSSLAAGDEVLYLSLLTQVVDEDPIEFDTG